MGTGDAIRVERRETRGKQWNLENVATGLGTEPLQGDRGSLGGRVVSLTEGKGGKMNWLEGGRLLDHPPQVQLCALLNVYRYSA